MDLRLTETLKIVVTPQGDGRITQIYLGDQELVPEHLVGKAAAKISVGVPPSQEELAALLRAGVLVPSVLPDLPDAVALGQMIAVDVHFSRKGVVLPAINGPGQIGVQPQRSHSITQFIPPYRLAPLQRFAAELQRAWFDMLRASYARGESLSDKAVDIIASIARNRVETDPALQAVLEIESDDPLCFRPLVTLQEEVLHYPPTEVRLLQDRHPPPGSNRLRIAVNGPEQLSTLSRLLGMLAAGTTPEALRAAFGSDRWAHHVLIRLACSECLCPLPAPIDSLAPGEIIHLGHAAMLVNLDGRHVLIDPWLVPGSRRDQVAPPDMARLPPIDAIFFTHHHWDHVEPESLLKLPVDVPVYVPSPSTGPLKPQLALYLESFGFTAVQHLAHDERIAFGHSGITALPFYGEDPTQTNFIANTYLLDTPAGRTLVHVDSGTDFHGQRLDTEAILARHGRVGSVWATRRQELGTMIEYGWEFLLAPVNRWVEPAENTCNDAAYLAWLCSSLGAGELVLYSEGGADWYPRGLDFLRGRTKDPVDQALELYWDDLNAISNAVGDVGATMILSNAWDRHRIGGQES